MIEVKDLTKKYHSKKGVDCIALNNVSFILPDKGMVFITGKSGSGKSTLLNILGGLDVADSGSITIDGNVLTSLSEEELENYRNTYMGFVFQDFYLIDCLTVFDNVKIALSIQDRDNAEEVYAVLRRLGLEEYANKYPRQLSGGEKQRVAIARALTTNPKVLLSDESTSALDPKTTQTILSLLRKINKELGITIVLITHEMKIVDELCDRVAIINNSQIDEIGNVSEVFEAPQSEFTKYLLNTKTSIIDKTTAKKLRLIFDNVSTYEPIVSNLILDLKVAINIIHADVSEENGIFTGSMLIEIPSDKELIEKVFNYLNKKKINFQEVE
jgi:D-methionine transport system ATP-binding protein